MLEKIKGYFEKSDLDLRKSHYSRFMDQKVTPDVVCFIADCIDNHIASDTDKKFTVKDIWQSQYFQKNVRIIFGKPAADNPNTSNEYDKFLAQPLRMLNYANVLQSDKKGTRYFYEVKNHEILQYIALKERNALNFIYEYLMKVLADSDLLRYFERYEKLYHDGKLKNADLQELKNRFQRFIIGNTQINKTLEVNRIFPKIINVFANCRNLPGIVRGSLSKDIFPFYDLMYNRVNFRDLTKLKSITRQEAMDQESQVEQQEEFNEYQIKKAMEMIKRKYSESEVRDELAVVGSADYVHHIFPRAEYPQLATYLENLIKLTSAQHYSKAHPKGKTTAVDKDYQLVCLISKSSSIEQSIQKGEFIYSKESFVFVINTGLSANLQPDISFRDIRLELNNAYKNC